MQIVVIASFTWFAGAADAALPAWSLQAPMPTARLGHAAAPGADSGGTKRIYVFGGSQGTGYVPQTEAYNPVTDTWATKAPMPGGRLRNLISACRATNGKIYVVGGQTVVTESAFVDEYDPATDTFTAKANMPTARWALALAPGKNGKIYAFGGERNSPPYDPAVVEEYDPSTNTWTPKGSLPGSGYGLMASTGCDGLIYVVTQNTGALWVYDPVTSTFDLTKSAGFQLYGSMTTGSDGHLYAIGSCCGVSGTARAAEYDPSADTWTLLPPQLSGGAGQNAAASLGDSVFAFGGYRKFGGTLNTTDKWGPLPLDCDPFCQPVPVINYIVGQTNSCAGVGTYSIGTPQSGITYTWTAQNGTISGSPTGPVINLTWGATGPYSVTLTATNTQGGCSTTKTLSVTDCNLHPCCAATADQIVSTAVTTSIAGALTVKPVLKAGPANITRVTAQIVSASIAYPLGCGANTNVAGATVSSASNSSNGMQVSLPVANGNLAVWHSFGGTPLTAGATFPFTLGLPAPPFWPCSDQVSFCIKYTFLDVNCQECEIIKCYGPFTRVRPHLLIEINPAYVSTGRVFGTQPVVSLVNDDGSLVTNFDGTVTATIQPGTGVPGAELGGQTTVPVVDGRATFQDLSLVPVGKDYVLLFTANPNPAGTPGPDPVASQPFSVVAKGRVSIYRALSAITPDGDITDAEWAGATRHAFLGDMHYLTGEVPTQPDYSGYVEFKWDFNNLYFAAHVIDDVPSFPESPIPNDFTGRDALDILLGVSGGDPNRSEYNQRGDFDISITADDTTPPGGSLTARWYSPQAPDTVSGNPNTVAFVRRPGGYDVEGRIPWTALAGSGFQGIPNAVIGFNVQARDNDQPFPHLDTLLSLSGLSGAETNPSTWTSAILLNTAAPLPGDTNGDGVVDATDVTLAAEMAGGKVPANAVAIANSDMNGDGILDMRDATRINRLFHGL